MVKLFLAQPKPSRSTKPGFMVRRKPLIKKIHMKFNLEFAKRHVWKDEMKIELGFDTKRTCAFCRQTIWQKPNLDNNITPTVMSFPQ